MTEQDQAANGSVAEEAARLLEAMASMAGYSDDPGHGRSPYSGWPAQDPVPPLARHARTEAGEPAAGPDQGAPNACGCEHDSTPVACKLCPLCQGIALLRSVRPETVDRLADLASAVAESLRDMATRTRESRPASPASSASASSSARGRANVQDIPVDDESEE